jgi:hypothetical protein
MFGRSFKFGRRFDVLAALGSLLWAASALAQDAAAPSEPAVPAFAPADAEVGLSYPMPDEPTVALLDFDLDGYVDVITGSRMWRNNGRDRFEQPVVVRGTFLSFGDYDNDGDLDIFSTAYRRDDNEVKAEHFLLRNDGGGKYVDVLKKSGLTGPEDTKQFSRPDAVKYELIVKILDVSRAHGFLDYDNDGKLDLFVAGFEIAYSRETRRALPSRLFKGDGAGHFEDVTEAAGLDGTARPATAVAFCDFDNDGFVDICVANGRSQPNWLWRNQGDGTFKDVAEEVGATGGKANSRAVAVADFDNDGDFDIFVVNYARDNPKKPQPQSVLLRNDLIPDGSLHFTDVTAEVGLAWKPPEGFKAEATWASATWSDLNNDGWLDLFVTESCEGGKNHPNAPLKYGRFDSGYSKLWLSRGGQSFVRVDTERNKLRIEDSAGASAADYDNDGRSDLLVGSNPGKKSDRIRWFDPTKQRTTLLRNRGPASKSTSAEDAGYLNVVLSARDRALNGAVIEVTLDNEERLHAAVDTSAGGLVTGSNQLHFGLGSHAAIRIGITLPGGQSAGFEGPWHNAALLLDLSKKSPKEPRTIASWR